MTEDFENVGKHMIKQMMKTELDPVYKMEFFLNQDQAVEVMTLVRSLKHKEAMKCPEEKGK